MQTLGLLGFEFSFNDASLSVDSTCDSTATPLVTPRLLHGYFTGDFTATSLVTSLAVRMPGAASKQSRVLLT